MPEMSTRTNKNHGIQLTCLNGQKANAQQITDKNAEISSNLIIVIQSRYMRGTPGVRPADHHADVLLNFFVLL